MRLDAAILLGSLLAAMSHAATGFTGYAAYHARRCFDGNGEVDDRISNCDKAIELDELTPAQVAAVRYYRGIARAEKGLRPRHR